MYKVKIITDIYIYKMFLLINTATNVFLGNMAMIKATFSGRGGAAHIHGAANWCVGVCGLVNHMLYVCNVHVPIFS
jgi:hypothetical protein